MKTRELTAMLVVAVALLQNNTQAMGAKRTELEQHIAAYKQHEKAVKKNLNAAKARAKEANQKVSIERGSKAAGDLQSTAVEVGVKSSVRAITQATNPRDNKTSVKNTAATILDVRKLGGDKHELYNVLGDLIGDTDARKDAVEAAKSVEKWDKELKATQKEINRAEKALKELSKPNREPNGSHEKLWHSEPRPVERDVIGGRDTSKVV